MKKLLVTLLTLCISHAAFAQLSGNGFYRIQSKNRGNYITLQSNRYDIVGSGLNTTVDMSAMVMVSGSTIISDPASVFFIKSAGGNYYDLSSQGENTYAMTGNRLHVTIEGTNPYVMHMDFPQENPYVKKYLAEKSGTDVVTPDGASTFQWNILPISASSNNYFGIKGRYKADEKYYNTLYAAFAFSFASTGMKAYVLDEIDRKHNIALIKEVTGVVPAATPVIIECSSDQAVDNKLNLLETGGTAPSKNYLKGVYFSKTDAMANYVKADPETMRVLGIENGELVFKKPTTQYIPANTAYIEVAAGSADCFKVMKREVYDNLPDVTITIKDAVREYGAANPEFKYEVTPADAKLGGTLVLTCPDAKSNSPVGSTFTITADVSNIANPKVTLVTGKMTINPATVAVSVRSYQRMKGEANPNFADALSYSGWKNGESEAVMTARPTVTCAATATSPGGEYPIIVSGAVAPNYTFVYGTGTLTVYDCIIKADDVTREYGDFNPNFSWTPDNVVSGYPDITCTADKFSGIGTYPLTISKGTLGSDYVLLEGGTLTIVPATITASFDQKDYYIVQGDPLPDFSSHIIYRGLKNNDTRDDVLSEKPHAVYAPNLDTKREGDYELALSGGKVKDSNYTLQVSTSKATLHIVAVDPITVVADTMYIYYGDDIPTFTYKVEGTVPLQGEPVFTCKAVKGSPVNTKHGYEITVSQGTVTNLNFHSKDAVLYILPAPLTIKAGTYTKRQGEEMPKIAITYEGFKLGENETTEGVFNTFAHITCTATYASEPGRYPVTFTSKATSDKYDITHEEGVVIVNEAEPMTIKAKDVTRTYGEGRPSEFSYVVTGNQVLNGTPSLFCNASERPTARDYVIQVYKGTGTNSVKNFNVTYENGVFRVLKKDLRITARSYEREMKEQNPMFELDYDGFVYDEDASVLIGKPILFCDAKYDSAPGNYEIKVLLDDVESQNYNLIPISGTLTVKVPAAIRNMDTTASTFDVYTTAGVLVKKDATTLKGLPKGVYIVNGQKRIVK